MSHDAFSVLSVERRGEALHAEIAVASNGGWFDGHFPGAPVLPAIAHFDLLGRIHRAGGGSGRIGSLDRVRLTSPVAPGDRLALDLEPLTTETSRFTLQKAGGDAVSSGTVGWVPDPERAD